jgi:hypothetical protein
VLAAASRLSTRSSRASDASTDALTCSRMPKCLPTSHRIDLFSAAVNLHLLISHFSRFFALAVF